MAKILSAGFGAILYALSGVYRGMLSLFWLAITTVTLPFSMLVTMSHMIGNTYRYNRGFVSFLSALTQAILFTPFLFIVPPLLTALSGTALILYAILANPIVGAINGWRLNMKGIINQVNEKFIDVISQIDKIQEEITFWREKVRYNDYPAQLSTHFSQILALLSIFMGSTVRPQRRVVQSSNVTSSRQSAPLGISQPSRVDKRPVVTPAILSTPKDDLPQLFGALALNATDVDNIIAHQPSPLLDEELIQLDELKALFGSLDQAISPLKNATTDFVTNYKALKERLETEECPILFARPSRENTLMLVKYYIKDKQWIPFQSNIFDKIELSAWCKKSLTDPNTSDSLQKPKEYQGYPTQYRLHRYYQHNHLVADVGIISQELNELTSLIRKNLHEMRRALERDDDFSHAKNLYRDLFFHSRQKNAINDNEMTPQHQFEM